MNIFTDGSGKTGKYCYVIPEKKRVKIFQIHNITNNESEYLAVISALRENAEKNISIYSDSQLIVNQLNRNYKIKEKRLQELASKVWKLCEGRNVIFMWVPRERNLAGKVLG